MQKNKKVERPISAAPTGSAEGIIGVDIKAHRCDVGDCDRSFPTHRGLVQHKRLSHPVERHAELLDQHVAKVKATRSVECVLPTRDADAGPGPSLTSEGGTSEASTSQTPMSMISHTKWTMEELTAMAINEHRLKDACKSGVKGQGLILALAASAGGRTAGAVQAIRKTQAYKQCLLTTLPKLNIPIPEQLNELIEPAVVIEIPSMQDLAKQNLEMRGLTQPVEVREEALDHEWCTEIKAYCTQLLTVRKLDDDLTLLLRHIVGGTLTKSILSAFTLAKHAIPSKTSVRNKKRKISTPNPVHPKSKRCLRRTQYAQVQKLYLKNRSAAAETVLSGSWRGVTVDQISDEIKTEFWRNVFEGPTKRDGRVCDVVDEEMQFLEPVTFEETAALLISITKSAAGPDGISSEEMKRVPIIRATAFLNACLMLGEALPSFLVSRTVLIPKADIPSGPEEFRPISISNMDCRLYHKLLASRAERLSQLAFQQRAFRSVDGVAANTMVLNAILSDAKRKNKSLVLTFIDLRKAFDTVSHDSIIRCAGRAGLPSHLLSYLRTYYSNGTTCLLDQQMRLNNGVRQGDPLSPWLFNAVMDEALSHVSIPGMGYEMNGEHISYLAFADDVVLINCSSVGAQSSCDNLLHWLSESGLTANILKCSTLRIQGDGKEKRWFVDARNFLRVEGKTVPALNIVQSYKYLGLQVSASKKLVNVKEHFAKAINELLLAPLKPQQRIFILKAYLMPRFMHQLVLGRVNVALLRFLDREIRAAVRKTLKWPKDTHLSVFYSKVSQGGLGLKCLTNTVPYLRSERLTALLNVHEPDVIASRSFIRLCLKRIGKFCQPNSESEHWQSALHNSCDGKGLRHANEVVGASDWVQNGTSLMSGANYIKAIKIRNNLWWTEERAIRGRGRAPKCDAGCNATSNLGHMLQSCSRTHDQRVKRHDKVISFIADTLRKKGWSTIETPSIITSEGLRKPDLIGARGSVSFVLDGIICGDSNIHSPDTAHKRKIAYYNKPDVTSFTMNAFAGATSCVVGAVSISWRGVPSRLSWEFLRSLGVVANDLLLMVVMSLEGSVRMADTWHKRTTGASGEENRAMTVVAIA